MGININVEEGYNGNVELLRKKEYPHMSNGIYLDHSGATIYAKSAVEGTTQKLLSNLYGNPHSQNTPAHFSGVMVDAVRAKTLDFFGADAKNYDLIFVANATAAIKLVSDAFRDIAQKTHTRKFWYGFHKDSHTSLVGIRQLTHGQHHCFESDGAVEAWLENPQSVDVTREDSRDLGLFAYPGQSNLSGRRLPLSWAEKIRGEEVLSNTYTLLDAAALAMTTDMKAVFEDVEKAPDFVCMSLYKIFGLPDLGCLVVRKTSGHILALRKYFGGGTVSLLSVIGDSWHRSKGLDGASFPLHDGLEDGTLPFHSILALGEAIDTHKKLYGSMKKVSDHTAYLSARLFLGLANLRHSNGRAVCSIYNENTGTEMIDPKTQGSTFAFNLLTSDGEHIAYQEVEKLANEAGIYIRSGGVCNPGGIYTLLGYQPWTLDRLSSSGHLCGFTNVGVISRLPTGVVRASIGAMTTRDEIDKFLGFIRDNFQEIEKQSTSSLTLWNRLSADVAKFDLSEKGTAFTHAMDIVQTASPPEGHVGGKKKSKSRRFLIKSFQAWDEAKA